MSHPNPTAAHPLKLGTRASPLAMAQAHMVSDALRAAHGWEAGAIEICTVVASGDKVLDRALADLGGKALWTKELDHALLEGHIDCAVHSMKDVETLRPIALTIAAILPRADVRDTLLGANTLADIPSHGVVGTSSPRRKAQILRGRPDLSIVLFRGNVQTRLAKLEAGEVNATLLAAAGLDRLEMGHMGARIATEQMLPAPAQAAIGVECRKDDALMLRHLAPINHMDSYRCIMAERALLAGLSGTCHSPIGALAIPQGDGLLLRAEILSPDGQEHRDGEVTLAHNDLAGAQALAAIFWRAPAQSYAHSLWVKDEPAAHTSA